MNAYKSWLSILILLVTMHSRAACFLMLEGIPGESIDEAHRDQIDALSFSWGVAATEGAIRANFGDFVVQKAVDKTSPELALRCAAGTTITNVVFSCRRAGASFDYLTIRLTRAYVTSVSQSGGGSDVATEAVSFSYERISWEYVSQNPTGGTTTVRRYFNLITNTGGVGL
jgi:type VI secretion system secreted protein Hcp